MIARKSVIIAHLPSAKALSAWNNQRKMCFADSQVWPPRYPLVSRILTQTYRIALSV